MPLVLSRATLDEAAPPRRVAPTIHCLPRRRRLARAGLAGAAVHDRRSAPGHLARDAHGRGRRSRSSGSGEWLSLADGERSAFMVMERNDLPSSRVGYDGRAGSAVVDFSRDILSLGPFEEQAHVENPGRRPRPRAHGAARASRSRCPRSSPASAGSDGDEPWQFHRYLDRAPAAAVRARRHVQLERRRREPHLDRRQGRHGPRDGRRRSRRSRGGWASRRSSSTTAGRRAPATGSPTRREYPEPRWDGSPDSKFRPRFPDSRVPRRARRDRADEARAVDEPHVLQPVVRDLRAASRVGLPPARRRARRLRTRPTRTAARTRPGSARGGRRRCRTSSAASARRSRTGASATSSSTSSCGSTASGARTACATCTSSTTRSSRCSTGCGPTTPEVTFQIDETNDYRLFPFESVARGPTWFQNGGPSVDRMLHNLWNLSPYVPTFALGQNALANEDFARYPVDTLMAAALLSHITFFQRPAPPAGRGDRPGRRVDRVLQAAPRPARRRRLPAARRSAGAQAGPRCRRGTPRRAPARCSRSARAPATSSGGSRCENVPPGRTFELTSAPDGAVVGTVTSEQLRTGIDVEIPQAEGGQVLMIRPAP